MPRDVGPVMIWAVWSARWLRRHAYVLEFRSDHGRDCPDAGVNPRLAFAAASALAERRTCLVFVPKRVVRLCGSHTYVAVAGPIESSRQMWCADPAGVYVHISRTEG